LGRKWTCYKHSHKVAEKGPCPKIGWHVNVKFKKGKEKPIHIGSIVCCPTCEKIPNGPKIGILCKFIKKE
jgi:hypothetical protein